MTNPDDREDVDLAVKTKPRTQRPPLYKVLLLNDDFTPMEFVVHVLERLFKMTHAQAIEIMLTVHRKGVAVVGVFSHEIAETKVAQVMELARRQQQRQDQQGNRADRHHMASGAVPMANAVGGLRVQPSAATRSSTTSKGTPGSSLAQRITRLVLTEATFGAAVRLSVRKR